MKVKYPLPTSDRYAFMQWCDIPQRGDKDIVYLRRLRVLQTPYFGVMIHWINDIDEGPYPHDHPWTWFRTFVVRGGYTETFYKRFSSFINNAGCTYVWKRWSSHTVRYYSGHQIIGVLPGTITLVFHGKRIRRFCFWTRDRSKVPYNRIRPEEFGYKTREASAKPWAEVPEQNKALMVAVASEVLKKLGDNHGA